jgi:ketosteroid isomerase-like protein
VSESERVTAVREAYSAYNRGEYDSVLELMHPDIEWRPPAESLEPKPLRGRDAVREYMAPNLLRDQRAEPVEIVDAGDRILVEARASARGVDSGLEVVQTVFHVWTIADEQVVRFEVYATRAEAQAALVRGEPR